MDNVGMNFLKNTATRALVADLALLILALPVSQSGVNVEYSQVNLTPPPFSQVFMGLGASCPHLSLTKPRIPRNPFYPFQNKKIERFEATQNDRFRPSTTPQVEYRVESTKMENEKMKNNVFNKIKIRTLDSKHCKRLKNGRELRFEVSAPKSLNGGQRFRSCYATKQEAETIRQRFINNIKQNGVGKPLIFRKPALKSAPPATLTGIGMVLSVFRDIYIEKRLETDSCTAAHMNDVGAFFDMLMDKYGDIPVVGLTVTLVNDFLSDPPPTKNGTSRNWSTSSRKRYTDTGQALWNWGMRYLVDDFGKSFITYNPWTHVYTNKLYRRKPVKVHTDFILLDKVWEYCREKRWDFVGALTLKHHCGLRPRSEIAGGRTNRDVADSGRKPLLYGDIHLDSIPGYPCGWVDVTCYKTENSSVKRRQVPLSSMAQEIFRTLKGRFADSDPVLAVSSSAFDQGIKRCFAEASMDLYGFYADQCGNRWERDLFRHSCLTAWVNLVGEDDRNLHSLSRVARWAGHGTHTRTLEQYYLGVMTPIEAADYFEIGVPSDWNPPLNKPGNGNAWHPDERRRAQWWGRHGRARFQQGNGAG